ncbi:HsdM family class I SAM-dependent methyltransferase [Paraclostridium tenue]
MIIDIKDIKFPTYEGLESQYEHNVYKYLEETIGKNGYTIKIKKTDYENVDGALVKGGRLSCDAYIFNNEDKRNNGNNLIALFELESNLPKSKLDDGVKQIQEYCKLLSLKYQQGLYSTANKTIKAIVFDGLKICVWEYDIESQVETAIIGNPDTLSGENMDKNVKIKLLDLFPPIEKKKDEASEEKTINDIKDHLRANSLLQANKSFLMTILAAIYGKTKTENFEKALSKLEVDTSDNESVGILKEWNIFSPKIDYDKVNANTKEVIKEKLYEDAKSLWVLSQNKNMDLYGFIYEELAEEKSKQDEGEFYTSRHIIEPIISSVLKKYVFPVWNIKIGESKVNLIKTLSDKNILDPFCGSGGFLYEFLRFLKINYQFKDSDINKIAASSLYGFDKNDIMSAFLNMYLIGDGATNLCQVTSSINWQNMWNYTLQRDTAKLIEDKDKLEENIVNNKDTFKNFLNQLLKWDDIKNSFSLAEDYSDFNSFCEHVMQEKSINETELFSGIIEYKKDTNCVLRYFYNLFLEYSSNKDKCTQYNDFLNGLGNVDFLMTNIPYGSTDDAKLTTKEKGTLELLALKQCIDLLKPSSSRRATYNEVLERWEDDENGYEKSNNDGGIASIIIPNGIFESENNKELRDYLFKRCNVLGIVKLPTLSFAPYASIQTFIITIQKKAIFEFDDDNQSKKCFFYIVDNDGKANSKNRYSTELIGRGKLKIDNNETVIHEYLHDDLAINIERYPEGYMSKLERAWVHGQNIIGKDDWNQTRYNEKWNGKEWEKITDTSKKWTFKNLEKRLYEKRIKKENKNSSNLLQICYKEVNNFDLMDSSEQIELAINRIKKSILDKVESIKVKLDKNQKISVEITSSDSKINDVRSVQNIIKIYYDNFIDETKELKNGKKEFNINVSNIKEFIGTIDEQLFPKRIKNIVEFLSKVEDIEFNGDNVSFYTIESYYQYVLIPENYLEKKEDFMSYEDIIANVIRLRRMVKET